MNMRITNVFAVLMISLGAVTFLMAAKKPIRITLENTWKDYIDASKSGKESELEKMMSSFRFGAMKNNLASAKRSLTSDIIKRIAKYSPDISTADFVTLLEKGPTAGLVYVKDSEEKDAKGKPRVNFIFIKFVKEKSGWKVDAAMNVGSLKYLANGTKAEFKPADLPPTYQIDGIVRVTPQQIAAPYASALLDVFSYGYKTEVIVNNIRQGSPVTASRSMLVKRGLRKGRNSVTIIITKTENGTVSNPTVTIRRSLKDRKMKEVFKFEPKENIEGKHKFNFTVE